MNELSARDIDQIHETLSYYRNSVMHSEKYPNYETKKEKLDYLDGLITKIRAIRDDLRG